MAAVEGNIFVVAVEEEEEVEVVEAVVVVVVAAVEVVANMAAGPVVVDHIHNDMIV